MKSTRPPAPAMPLLTPHDEYSMAQLIERHIEFYRVDAQGNERTVALNPVFVRHYMHCRDSKLPVVTTIVTSPLVLPNGELLATQGLDRKRGIVFRLQPELVALLPTSEECTLSEVTKAMRFLTDEWLCDVATDYSGKCVIIAAALTISRTRSLAGAAGILRDRGTARWRQNDDTADVVPRRNRHTRSCSGVVDERGGDTQMPICVSQRGRRGRCVGQYSPRRDDFMPIHRKMPDRSSLQ
jgi:hypothetical protein